MRVRTVVFLSLILFSSWVAQAAESCVTIHGRLHSYSGDGQLRIWHIGTHHDFTPDESTWGRVVEWLSEGATESDKKKYACPACAHDLYADFLLCPTEPYKRGSVQKAKVISAKNRHYVRVW